MSEQLKAERELLSPPGDDILETIEYKKMTQAELAERLGKTPSKVNDLITGKEPITYNTALQLEKVLGIEAQFWLNRETNYRTKLARLEQEEKLEEELDWLKQQPIKEMRHCGYLKSSKQDAAMVQEALEFYGVVNTDIWEHRYINDYATAAYRKSAAHHAALGSMAAWLRMGELEMEKMKLPDYDKEAFKKVLEQVKELVAKHPADFAARLQQQCAAAGVAVVYTICLPKAPVSGATRWFRNNPMIQLTDRHKTNDQFWFTFYHEAGHVLLHGKKELFFEEFEGYKPDEEKENEANRFAAKHLLPDSFEDELPFRIIEEDAVTIAKKYNTHPGIVIGRLQRMGLLHFSRGNKYKVRVDLITK